MKEEIIRYHCFIAHGNKDIRNAINLYNILTTQGLVVYLDVMSLKPGDLWDNELKKAQYESLVTLILISNETDSSFYLKEEIAYAIEMSIKLNRKLIPIYYNNSVNSQLKTPYGLKRIQSLHVTLEKGLEQVSEEVLSVVNKIDKTNFKLSPSFHDYERENLEYITKKEIKPDFVRILSELDNIRLYAKKNNLDASLIFFDIDGMTQIKKYKGEDVADGVTMTIKEICAGILKNKMSWHKLGSDEYIIFGLNLNIDKAKKIANNICTKINNFNWDKLCPNLRVSASFGVSQYSKTGKRRIPGDGSILIGENSNEWIIRAIYGSRDAKKDGGNKVKSGPLLLPEDVSFELIRYVSSS